MHAFIQAIIQWYFGILHSAGLVGVVILMAMESTIFPLPSELVVPPAAYIEAYRDGNYDLFRAVLVVLAGTVGSYVGSAATYWVSRAVGRPIIVKYGKYFFIPEKKLQMAEAWVARYGGGGIFFARLLPVIRHLISIPAGIVGMDFGKFSLMTTLGAGLWCAVLTVFGLVMAQDMGAVLQSGAESEGYKLAFRNLTIAIVVLVGIMGVLYVAVVKRSSAKQPAPGTPGDDPVQP